ncbi:MAG: hypothetical protein ABIF10_06325 [Candidatus Woesearchaeota archaeon]
MRSRLVLTDFLQRELEVNYSVPEINCMFKMFEKITLVSTSKQRSEAKTIAEERNVPPGDMLFAIVARDNDVKLVSRDRHFNCLKDIAEYSRPEDLL